MLFSLRQQGETAAKPAQAPGSGATTLALSGRRSRLGWLTGSRAGTPSNHARIYRKGLSGARGAAAGHKADSVGGYAAAWTKTKPAPRRETINFLQAWGRQQALSSGGRDSGPGEGLSKPREGAGEELSLGGPCVQGEPCLKRVWPGHDLKGPLQWLLLPCRAGRSSVLFTWLLVGSLRYKPSSVISLLCASLGKSPQTLVFFLSFT